MCIILILLILTRRKFKKLTLEKINELLQCPNVELEDNLKN